MVTFLSSSITYRSHSFCSLFGIYYMFVYRCMFLANFCMLYRSYCLFVWHGSHVVCVCTFEMILYGIVQHAICWYDFHWPWHIECYARRLHYTLLLFIHKCYWNVSKAHNRDTFTFMFPIHTHKRTISPFLGLFNTSIALHTYVRTHIHNTHTYTHKHTFLA